MQCVAQSTCIVFDVRHSCISTTITPPAFANHNTHPMSFCKQLTRLVGGHHRGGGGVRGGSPPSRGVPGGHCCPPGAHGTL